MLLQSVEIHLQITQHKCVSKIKLYFEPFEIDTEAELHICSPQPIPVYRLLAENNSISEGSVWNMKISPQAANKRLVVCLKQLQSQSCHLGKSLLGLLYKAWEEGSCRDPF